MLLTELIESSFLLKVTFSIEIENDFKCTSKKAAPAFAQKKAAAYESDSDSDSSDSDSDDE